ncbi:MAG: DoxX family membrane protein [Chitinophagaceae bacterium]|nr:DoxX family membrane protein [Chitinophagaceae bacterium]
MKGLLILSRAIVGILFIFSGLIKANDPLGLSYKMQEFFEVWGWHTLNDYTLAFSVLMIAFEIIAGVAVLVGWRMRLFSWLLLLLILFFTFLTGYALFSGKIKECGCFGDCIPLQANQSFLKDLLLLVLIGFIFIFRERITPALQIRNSLLVLFFTAIFSFSLQWYVLQHLPVLDCLPYKVGNNISEKMKIPAGAIPDSTVISFVYESRGKQVEFTADKFPNDFNDSTYTFIRRYDKLIRKGNAESSIKDFSLQSIYGNDTTQALLNEEGDLLFLFLKNDYKEREWTEILSMVMKQAEQKNIPGFLVTNIPIDELRNDPPPAFLEFTPLRCDATAIKTAARTNPTLYLVRKGTIIKKWGYADFEQAIRFMNNL